MAGFKCCEVKLKEGRDKAAAQTLDVAEVAALEVVGEACEAVVPWPGLCACRCNCRAFARAFSWVRTKYARFCWLRQYSSATVSPRGCRRVQTVAKSAYLYEDLPILCVHSFSRADKSCI